MFYYEYLRDDPSQKFLYFKSPLTAETHMHKGIELIIAQDGAAEIGYNGTVYRLQKGDVIFIPALTEHSIDAPASIALLLIPVAYLDYYTKHITNTYPDNPIIPSAKAAHITDDILRFDEIDRDNELKVYSQIYKILDTATDMLDFRPPDLRERMQFIDLISKITQYIEEHYADETLSINTLAHIFGYNKCYLSSALHEKLKINFRDYVNSIRLKKFIFNYDPELTLEQQLGRFGFSNKQTFYRAFVKIYGVPPTEYLNRTL